jgi:Xaa-Pro aminopeptidase
MANREEIQEKERRVRELLQARGLDALLLRRQANFCWMTGGGLNLVGITTELGVAALLVTRAAKFVVCSNIEAPRMAKEEGLEEQGYTVVAFPWHEDAERATIHRLVGKGRLGSDAPFADAEVCAEDIARLRYALTPAEVERFRWLGERASAGLERTLIATRPGETEAEVVARLCGDLWKDRIDPVTLMSAADDRVAMYRHPIPTERRIERFLMVSVNARKWGLIVSLTRFVHFGALPEALLQRYRDNVRIDCTFMAATQPGVPAREVLTRGIEAYRAAGYPEEWKLHHQGGAIGYTGRDYRTHFETPDVVQANQGFTWNPSLTGTKSEDTILATAAGPQPVTLPVLFPRVTIEVEGMRFERPAILTPG